MELFSIDLVNLLLFTMPGFFFLHGYGFEAKNDFAYLMFSMFWGVLSIVGFYQFTSVEWLTPLIENPYAGAIVLSVFTYIIGAFVRFLVPKFFH